MITHCSKQLRSLALFSFSPDIKQNGDEFDPTSKYIHAAGHRAALKQQAGRGGKRFWFEETSEKSVAHTACFQLKRRFLSQMYPDQD